MDDISPNDLCANNLSIDSELEKNSIDEDYGYSSGSSKCHSDGTSDSLYRLNQVAFSHENTCFPPNYNYYSLEANDESETDDGIQDLLYNFGKYFSDRFERQICRFQDAMIRLFNEQQIHVQQIVNTAVNAKSEQMSSQVISDIPESSASLTAQNNYADTANSCCHMEAKTKNEKERHLLHLMTLSSAISSILQRKVYRSIT